MMRRFCALGILFGLASTALAEPVLLRETPVEDTCYRIAATTVLKGTLKVSRDDKLVPISIVAKNEHAFHERVLAVDKGLIRKSARHYEVATSTATIASDPVQRTLRDDRRLIVAQRSGDTAFCYSPAGPLLRTELEVVGEHFDTLHLVGLLPGNGVEIGGKWTIPNGVAQSLCLFDGLISQDFSATLKDVVDGKAKITLGGTAKGVEHGAMATLQVTATIEFDIARKTIVFVEWTQKDARDQGPITPAADLETTTTLRREPVAEPKELSKEALAGIAAGDEPPSLAKQLIYRDAKGAFQFLYSRDWHVVAQTDHHLVMRLLDRGDFVAQATLTTWKKTAPGKHLSPEEFQKLVSETPGWKMEQLVDHGEVPGDPGRWAYRITAKGMLDDVEVIQNFFLVANATGEQMIATFTMKPTNLPRLATKDLAIVNGIDFLRK
jgi:hypothetical protein